MSRADEIAQGLREPGGALIGGLNVEEYARGWSDWETGIPSPRGLTSTSYDLGRNRAREKKERSDELHEWLARRDAENDRRFREVMKDRPEELAEYDAKIAEIRAKSAA